jgi:hypothetical protein
MNMKYSNINSSSHVFMVYAFCLAGIALTAGCRKFLESPTPVGQIAGPAAYISDNSVASVVSGNFSKMQQSAVFSDNTCVGLQTGLYTDELKSLDYALAEGYKPFYTNEINSNQVTAWPSLYQQIYTVNTTIEGINSTKATLNYKDQWLGESLFDRAFVYFYLVNLFGDVPLTTTSDYKVNNVLARMPRLQVYQQMIADLKQAQSLLSIDYKDGYGAVTADRARPSRLAATALLARVYLYTGDWANAEKQADNIIGSTAYDLVTPSQAFLAASKETIWALAPTEGEIVPDFTNYNNNIPVVITPSDSPLNYGVFVTMSQSLINAFEPGDARFANWIGSSTATATDSVPAITYYFPNKYKSNVPGAEYMVMLRLAEQYLIRAEARAERGDISGAQADLNAVRARANLPATTANSQASLLSAILKERRIELFSELGNRFFDLKRTGTIDAVMNVAAQQKGGTWSTWKQIWPIPPPDIIADPNLTQAPGYQ